MDIGWVGRDANEIQYDPWLLAESDQVEEDSADPHQCYSTDHHPSNSIIQQYSDTEIDSCASSTHHYPQTYRMSSSIVPEVRFPPLSLYDLVWNPSMGPPYHTVSDPLDMPSAPAIDPRLGTGNGILTPTLSYSYSAASSLETPVAGSVTSNIEGELYVNSGSARQLDQQYNTSKQDEKQIFECGLEIQKSVNRCPVQSCRKTYTRPSELSRHKTEKHSTEASVWVCGHPSDNLISGTCGQNRAYTAVRKQHIKQHIHKTHKREISKLSVCTREGCYVEGRIRGLVFASFESLQEHQAKAHQLNAQVDTAAHLNGLSLGFSPHDLIDDLQEPGKGSQHPSPGAKHSATSLKAPLVKKRRVEANGCHSSELESSMLDRQYSQSRCLSNKDVSPLGTIPASPLINHATPASYEVDQSVVEISDVKPAEFVAISQRDEIIRIDEDLNAVTPFTDDCSIIKNGNKSSNFIFILSRKSIQLRGPAGEILVAKAKIEDILVQVKRYTRGGFGEKRTSLKHSDDLLETTNGQPRATQHTGVFPLRVEEDSHYIHIWRVSVLPVLAQILSHFLGADYSAALVRQGTSDQTSSVVIRIQSPTYYARIRQKIREAIGEIYDSLGELAVKTNFSSGKLNLLAGVDNDDEDDEDQELPHHKRWWKYAGMGASLGLRCNRRVSGTLGGYIVVDGDSYLLTADHFIERARLAVDPSTTEDKSSREIMSPSPRDIQEMLSSLQASLIDAAVGLENELEERGQDELRIAEVQGLQLRDWHNQLQTWSKELDGRDEDFYVGEVKQRCGRNQVEVISNGSHVLRKMDWALCTVADNRKGDNRHRYRSKLGPMSTDYKLDGLHPKGAGDLCTQTCPVQAGAQVHYVGAGTGYQSAKINPSEVLVSIGGFTTIEWSLVLKDGVYNTHHGDSGAWIIQDRGQSLVGMLWGEQNTLLYFTPVGEIFDDIKSDMRANQVCLPPPAYMPPSSSNAVMICSDLDKPSRARKFRYPFAQRQKRPLNTALSKIPSPSNKGWQSSDVTQPLTNQERSVAVEPKPQSSSPRSPSPVPSLTSSEASLSESSLDCPSPSSPGFIDLHAESIRLTAKALEIYDIETNKRSLEFILESTTLDPENNFQTPLSGLNSLYAPEKTVIV